MKSNSYSAMSSLDSWPEDTWAIIHDYCSKLLGFIAICNQYMCMLSHFSHVWFCNPMDCSPQGSSVHRSLLARILAWVAISSSRGSSWPRDWTLVSSVCCIAADSLHPEPPGKQPIRRSYRFYSDWDGKLLEGLMWLMFLMDSLWLLGWEQTN